ncbi:MAG: 4Fe-4S dicluster domain-containing protein [Phycisphaerae bacterium]|nr:4Fe-4S dicluster domain-containing protein [Phycisphaerae bacterium]
MSINRREFLGRLGVLGAGAAAATVPAGKALAAHGETDADPMGVLVDIPTCIGCRKCEYACQEAAGFAPPPIETFEDKKPFEQYRRPRPDSYTVVNRFENPASEERPIHSKVNCLHCIDPACASACLVGAFHKEPTGAVVYDAWKCMGCRYCMVACPFQIPTYEYQKPLTPQVRKCNFCAPRIAKEGGVPACVAICPVDCMTYGRRSELLSLAREKIAASPDVYVDHVYGEHEVGGTSWMYLSSVPFEDIKFHAMGSGAPPILTETVQHAIFKHWVPPIVWAGILATAMWMTRPREDSTTEDKTADPSRAHGNDHRPAKSSRLEVESVGAGASS